MSNDPPSDISRLEDALEIIADRLGLIAEWLKRIGKALEHSKPAKSEE